MSANNHDAEEWNKRQFPRLQKSPKEKPPHEPVTDIKLIIPHYEPDALEPKYVDEITINTAQRPGIMHAANAMMDPNEQISERLWNFMKESYVPPHWDIEKFKVLMMRPKTERLEICRWLLKAEISERKRQNI